MTWSRGVPFSAICSRCQIQMVLSLFVCGDGGGIGLA